MKQNHLNFNQIFFIKDPEPDPDKSRPDPQHWLSK